jgi:hypothetical protein
LPRSEKNDIAEIFGFAPDDLSPERLKQWKSQLCPFVDEKCSKVNHDKSIVYGVCSVTYGGGEIIVCPKRLYCDNYSTIRAVANDAFGSLPLLFYDQAIEAIANDTIPNTYLIAFGQKSGKEVSVQSSRQDRISMDWVIAKIVNRAVTEMAGIEVQTIDITNNYRDTWQAYKELGTGKVTQIPASKHGMNWANVHKRLIPQLIRKGKVYTDSVLNTKGLYFVVPEEVFLKFESIIGPTQSISKADKNVLSIFTYTLGPEVMPGKQRTIIQRRVSRCNLDEFASNFIAGPRIPGSAIDSVLNDRVKKIYNG